MDCSYWMWWPLCRFVAEFLHPRLADIGAPLHMRRLLLQRRPVILRAVAHAYAAHRAQPTAFLWPKLRGVQHWAITVIDAAIRLAKGKNSSEVHFEADKRTRRAAPALLSSAPDHFVVNRWNVTSVSESMEKALCCTSHRFSPCIVLRGAPRGPSFSLFTTTITPALRLRHNPPGIDTGPSHDYLHASTASFYLLPRTSPYARVHTVSGTIRFNSETGLNSRRHLCRHSLA